VASLLLAAPLLASSSQATSGQSPSPSAVTADSTSAVIARVVDQVSPAVVVIDVTLADGSRGTGSGVILDPDGLILTNRHVAGDAASLAVTLADGRVFDGTVAGIDTLTDFAFVRIKATDLPTAQLGDSSKLQVGQLAIAIGDPLGQFPGTVTVGVVSGLDRTLTVADETTGEPQTLRHAIQTDASINPGNSGGPLVDDAGRVVGIDTAGSGAAQGIGFALPIDIAKPIIAQVRAGKAIARPFIGISYVDITGQVAEDADLPVTDGAWIHTDPSADKPAVVKGGPGDKAGLKEGDIITAVGDTRIDRDHQLDTLLLQHAPQDVVTLTVLRSGKERQVDVTLGERPAA